MTDYRAALIDFYQKHNPDKIREIDLLLAKYKGREEELLHALKVKYGVHKTAQAPPPQPPTPQQAAPSPKAEYRAPEPDARTERIIEKKTEPPPPVFEKHKQPIGKKEDDYQAPSSSGDSRGRTAAERAEYWKKELERRERERTGAREPASPRYAPKGKKEIESRADEYAHEEERNRASWFTVNRIIALIIVIALLSGIAFILLSSDLRKSVGAKFGFDEKSERNEAKKSVIEPAELAHKPDTAAAKNSGDFALDGEQEAEDRAYPEKPEESNKSAGDEAPARTEENSGGGVKRNSWYLSYSSVSQESLAKKIVKQLQSEGYSNSGYYYIPDYDSRGKRLYKVYIGPFASMESAEATLEGYLAKKGTGAYPFLLK